MWAGFITGERDPSGQKCLSGRIPLVRAGTDDSGEPIAGLLLLRVAYKSAFLIFHVMARPI